MTSRKRTSNTQKMIRTTAGDFAYDMIMIADNDDGNDNDNDDVADGDSMCFVLCSSTIRTSQTCRHGTQEAVDTWYGPAAVVHPLYLIEPVPQHVPMLNLEVWHPNVLCWVFLKARKEIQDKKYCLRIIGCFACSSSFVRFVEAGKLPNKKLSSFRVLFCPNITHMIDDMDSLQT